MSVAIDRLTYEQYLAEPEIRRRYDILDGVRVFMTNPTIQHQEIQGNVYRGMYAWRQAGGAGRVLQAPCDVLIQRSPLRTRQPDVLVISYERLGNRSLTDPSPLDPAPELIVEILSPSDTRSVLNDKLADYAKVSVKECWIIYPVSQTVEFLRFTAAGTETAATYRSGNVAQSIIFPTLALAVADVFAS
jgi:Uma2 family endonuclease